MAVDAFAGRRGVDPIEAAQITGHSPEVWARHYARSFGKAQRQEARRRMLDHSFGAAGDEAKKRRPCKRLCKQT